MAHNLGLKTMAILGIPDVPGFMIELGNINDKSDLTLMKDKKYRANLINSISFALDDYIRFYK
jgi:N-acetylmuramoyl-L-alanine amidase